MKASSWMVVPLVLGLSLLTVACDTPEDTEVNEQLETEPTGVEPVEGEATEEAEEGEGND
ncbi:MAG: hypothetical protein DCF32_03095 [Leptolyngbya sp.]|nr:MAG: hypothetical protein DCF32_03095 [Leptolyngbya sp.]